jgi:hypothetical protein
MKLPDTQKLKETLKALDDAGREIAALKGEVPKLAAAIDEYMKKGDRTDRAKLIEIASDRERMRMVGPELNRAEAKVQPLIAALFSEQKRFGEELVKIARMEWRNMADKAWAAIYPWAGAETKNILMRIPSLSMCLDEEGLPVPKIPHREEWEPQNIAAVIARAQGLLQLHAEAEQRGRLQEAEWPLKDSAPCSFYKTSNRLILRYATSNSSPF